ncbi:MAG: prepilin-type N-terminal cleavage/methylation domain-containing protein [Fibrobacteres bacterium]|jgi:prepilin-type N-terminal cleavage/methylation domain-containing protein|nr:prepilin-type N-terminal cleavage/methylation domain-containing protein [Fibrobacterota bacterium]
MNLASKLESVVASEERSGLSMLEVLIALVVLGIIVTLYTHTSRIAQRTTGASIDWIQEGVVIEKTVENLRIGHTLDRLQTFDSSWTDNSSQFVIHVSAKGEAPNPADFAAIPTANLAVMTISARRSTFRDSVVVKTVLWVP